MAESTRAAGNARTLARARLVPGRQTRLPDVRPTKRRPSRGSTDTCGRLPAGHLGPGRCRPRPGPHRGRRLRRAWPGRYHRPTFVVDQVETDPAHQRRGLGRVVMHTLTDITAGQGATAGVLVATPEGRALYETVGWHVLAPLTGAVRS
ncbi:GNAT family N-acetyltransferase [Streptomyces flaveus]|uniref:GNAT family N-acetyltransferase n=1 Tax=Streptomyces flaveus TaxID=66370 RepID=UPI00332ADECD